MLVNARNRGIANVIVALKDVPEDAVPPLALPASDRLVLGNEDCRFTPHVGGAHHGWCHRDDE